MLFAKHIAAFSNAFGDKEYDVVLPFAAIDWSTEDDRNQFINELISLNDGKRIGSN